MCKIIYYSDIQANWCDYHHERDCYIWWFCSTEKKIEYYKVKNYNSEDETHNHVSREWEKDGQYFVRGRLNATKTHATFYISANNSFAFYTDQSKRILSEKVLKRLLADCPDLRTVIDFSGVLNAYEYAY